MPIPSYTGRHVHVVPLTHTFNRNFMPMEANSELPVLLPYYEGREVYSMPLVPAPQKLPEGNQKVVTPPPLDVMNFMKGGQL